MDEINAVVEEYNTVEQEQGERLKKLYDLLGARKGYRRVQFSGNDGQWSNAWGIYQERPDIAYENHITPMMNTITEVIPGDE